MLFYLAIFSVVTTIVYVYQKSVAKPASKKWLWLLAIFLLVLMASLRVNVGTDYPNYVDLYYRISLGFKTHFEPGFVFINQISRVLFNSPQGVFILSSALYVSCVFYAVKRQSKNLALSIILFCVLPFYLYSFNAVRQAVALGMVLVASWYVFRAKFWKYFLVVCVSAVLFHKTALLMVPMYFLLRFDYRKYGYLLVLIAAGIVTMCRRYLINVLLFFYPAYRNQLELLDEGVSEIFVGMGLFGLVLVIYLLSTKRLSMKKNEHRIYINTVFYVLTLHSLFFWMPGAFRLYSYLDILLIIVIPNLISLVEDKDIKRFIIVLLNCILFVYFIISVGLNNSNDVLPYKTIFNDSIKSRDLILQKRLEWGLSNEN